MILVKDLGMLFKIDAVIKKKLHIYFDLGQQSGRADGLGIIDKLFYSAENTTYSV